MKRESPDIDNVIVDEANAVTYVVTARRRLTDGEIYSAIRVALLNVPGSVSGEAGPKAGVRMPGLRIRAEPGLFIQGGPAPG
jgi:hypothetical protein